MEKQNSEFYLIKTPIKKLLLKFSIPCILAMLVGALYNIVDQIFLGNSSAGQAGIMATTIVFPFTVIALAVAQLIGDGTAAFYSILLGQKDVSRSKKSVANSLVLSFVSGLVLMGLGFALFRPILGILGANSYDPTTLKFTEQYLTIILIGLPFYVFSNAMASVIRADGAPKFSMISTIAGAVINIILDPIFIFAFKMEVRGAAIATIVGQVISAVICLVYFRKMKMIKLEKSDFKPSAKIVGGFCKLGISSLITQLSIAVITIVANNVVGAVGGSHATDAGAALGIVFKVFAIILAFSNGVAVGGQPIIGYNYGAKRNDRVLETIKQILIVDLVIGLIATILFEFAPSFIVSLFGNGSAFYKDYAVLSFRIYLGGMLFCCLQKASCIILQSINKPYKAMFLSLTRDVIILVPGVCLLGLLGDLHLMLWAGIIADVGAFIPTIIFVLYESKKISKQNSAITQEKVPVVENKNFVVTIGREFGSGGKYIAQQLAKRLGVKCFDNQILTELANQTNLDIKKLQEIDESEKKSFWFGFANNYVLQNKNGVSSAEDDLFLTQTKIIEDIYKRESCVIVGRCSDAIFRENKNAVKVFIYASDIEFKIARKMKLENTTREQTIKNIEVIDNNRANYYHRYTNGVWGARENYDLMVDTSSLGVEKAIEIIENCVRQKIKL